MTRQKLLERGVEPQWIDEISFTLNGLWSDAQAYEDIYEYIYEVAFQDAESDYPSEYYTVNYHITKAQNHRIDMLVWIEDR